MLMHYQELQRSGAPTGALPKGEPPSALPRCCLGAAFRLLEYYNTPASKRLVEKRLAIRCLNALKVTVH